MKSTRLTERGGRLVEHHHVRIERERVDDRHSLLLAAGELRRILAMWVDSPTDADAVLEKLEQAHRFTITHVRAERRAHRNSA
jgi:hypothetical protein